MQTETEIQQALLRAEQHCKANGATLTAIRRTVLTLLYRARGGMKAYDLLDQVKLTKAGAAPPTVYRALDFLMEHGLVHKISKANVFRACSLGCHTHLHPGLFLVCPRCNAVEELDDHPATHSLMKSLSKRGYTIASEEIEVSAICPACKV
ncbi:MAG: transcriptional repressor [Burkholderiales bacterium]|jgi:Fur family zinc uptake transcriptional regulator|uniref:Fur family transcriptional regulator n=1 Tax=Limnobacter sp. TaxID=2003368 RepID=UPI00393ED564|nr:transcriptional repressor [Burkholderiales bacterium]